MTDSGPQSIADWIQYLHAAAQEPKDSPHYAESRKAMASAIRHIYALNVAATQGEASQLEKPVGPLDAAGVGLMHGLSLGAGEPIAGAISAIAGKGFGAGAERYREGLGNVETLYPATTAASELAGMFALPGGRVGQGVGAAIKAGVPLTVGQGAGLLGQGMVSGAVPGAIAGFSAGGEDPGDLQARLQAAKHSGEIGALLGGLATYSGARLQRGHVERAADLTNKGNQRALTASRLAESRARLARAEPSAPPAGFTAEEMAVAKTLGIPVEQVKGRVGAGAMKPRAAPGLLVPLEPMPGAPQGLLGPEGISPAPKASYPPSFAEMQGLTPASGKPGHPVWRGEGAPTRTLRTEPLTPSVEPQNPATALLRKQSVTRLRAALAKPETPSAVKQLIQIELKRRRG